MRSPDSATLLNALEQLKANQNFNNSFNRASLRGADLEGANLREANLYDADLSGADLSGADLREADLSDANLYDMICDENIILPDGTFWKDDTDWTKYGAVLREDAVRSWLSTLSDEISRGGKR